MHRLARIEDAELGYAKGGRALPGSGLQYQGQKVPIA
jgi:hypothetical protein